MRTCEIYCLSSFHVCDAALLTGVVTLPITDPNFRGAIFVKSAVTGSAERSVDTGRQVQSPDRGGGRSAGAVGQPPAQEVGPDHVEQRSPVWWTECCLLASLPTSSSQNLCMGPCTRQKTLRCD